MVKIFAIINVTPNSLLDQGTRFWSNNSMLFKYVERICEAKMVYGIDVGAESTAPNAIPISYKEEIERLSEVISEIRKITAEYGVKLSVDTRHSDTIKWSINQEVDYINDVSAGNIAIYKIMAESPKIKYIFMHNLGIPVDKKLIMPEGVNPIDILREFYHDRYKEMIECGMKHENIIFDPGIGFGNNAAQVQVILRNVDELASFGSPLYIGHSRKSFMRDIMSAGESNRDIETVALSDYLSNHNVDYIRIHNIDVHYRFFKMKEFLGA